MKLTPIKSTSACAALVLFTSLILFFALTLPAQASKQAVDFFGGAGSEGGQFGLQLGALAVNNTGAGAANQGDVYVIDSANNRIERFGRDDHGTPAEAKDDTYFFISAWGADVVQPGGAGDLGDAAVADYEICTVASQCKAGVASAGNGALGRGASSLDASAIAIDQDTGDLYLADAANFRVNVYEGTGNFLRSFGFDVDATTSGAGYEVCPVTDFCKKGLSGSAAGQIGLGPSPNFPTAEGIAVSAPDSNPSAGTVFLADSGNQRIDTYHLDGTSPATIGSAAQFSSDFDSPQRVAVDSRGILYAVNQIDGGGVGASDSSVLRYDTENADGGGVGFLAPLQAPYNENQRLSRSATAGQFRLSFDPDGGGPQPLQTSADIPYNASAAEVKAALESLSSIGAGNVTVNDCFCSPNYYTVRFVGALASTDVAQLSVANGSTPLIGSISVTTIIDGHDGALEPGTALSALTLGLDEDGPGPETDALYFAVFGAIQQFGPANPPGLSAPPSAEDGRHGTGPAFDSVSGVAAEPSTGRLYATARFGVAGPGVYVLDNVNPTPPVGTLDSIDNVSAHGLTAHGTINPNGLPVTSYHFEYSDDGSKWISTPTFALGAQEAPQPVQERIDPPGPGLRPNTLYHVRLVYQRRFAVPLTTAELTETTLPAPPLAETSGSPLRTATTATLLGRIDPNDSDATYHFEYGSQGSCDSNPCTATVDLAAGSGDEFDPASQKIEGLDPSTTYHYRIVADNGIGGPLYGADATLTTRASDAALSHGSYPGPPGSDRAYEQVSLPDTNGNPVGGVVGPLAFSADGERAVYSVLGGTPISESGSAFGIYFAQRPSGEHPVSGWQTSLITPPRDQLLGPNWAFTIYGTPDLSTMINLNFSGLSSVGGEIALWRLVPEGAPALLGAPVPADSLFHVNESHENSYGISADGSRIVEALSEGSFDPAFPAADEAGNYYDLSSGTPKLLSILPDGQPPACGLSHFGGGGVGAFGDYGAQAADWLSTDGSRILFESAGDDCSSSRQLYLREIEAAQTKLISGPTLSGPSCEASLIRATAEAVFFATKSRLAASDIDPSQGCGAGNSSANNDVYRYDLADQSLRCLTCLVAGLPADVHGDGLGHDIALSEDGSRLYFRSAARLLPGAPPAGEDAVYRLDIAGGALAYIAPGATIGPLNPSADLSSDGRFLIFSSSATALNPLGGASDNANLPQYYLYDDDRRSLLCVSCPPDGSPPLASASALISEGNHQGSPGISGLADDGTLAFTTTTPLLGADQNTPSGGDLAAGSDVYEWRDGRPLLVTDGITSWSIGPEALGISPSGRDLFFAAPARYTPDALDANRHLYDARLSGGIDFPPAREPCPLEVCQGTPQGAPAEQPPGSETTVEPLRTRPTPCPKGKVPRHGRCVPRPCPKRTIRRKGRCIGKSLPHKGRHRASHKRRASR